MGVTFYLFDTHQQVRAPLVEGVAEWIHHEGQHTLDAAIPIQHKGRPGEYLGMRCVDDRWRLFCITEADETDEKALTYIKATDAAVDDLTYMVVEDAYQENVTAEKAVETLLRGTGWRLGTVTAGDETKTTDAQWQSLWDALGAVASTFGVRILPYYVIEHGAVIDKRVDVLDDTPEYRGRFYQSLLDARDVTITYSNRPITVLYGLGKVEGTGEEAKRVTLADAVWSKANGDPVDKPAGQMWVEDAEAAAIYGRRQQILTAQDVTDPQELLRQTWEELQAQKKPKATVNATIRDMEQVPGSEWKKVRINDQVAVKAVSGEDVLARIVDIDRDYVWPEETKIKAGEELPSTKKQIAALTRAAIHTQTTLTIYRNEFLHDKALIQLNADTIQANAKLIQVNADEIEALLGEVEIQAEQIAVKADLIDLEAYVRIDQLEADILEVLTNATVQGSLYVEDTMNAYTLIGTDAYIENLVISGEGASHATLTMGEVVQSSVVSSETAIDLSHSHKVIVGEDGTVTLGEVSSEGGNFKIADTKTYKEGVSAAYGNGYNTGFDVGKDAYMPTAITRTGYDTAAKTVTVRALNSHQDLLTGQVISAAEIYNAGWNECIDAAVSWRVLVNYYSAGETLYDRDGNVATGPWYKGTEAYRYELPAGK